MVEFAVNGTDLPYADFDLGESYSGRLPISNDPKIKQELFFWFFPTLNQQHKDDKEIVIWLNGGVSNHPSPPSQHSANFCSPDAPLCWVFSRRTDRFYGSLGP